MVFSMLNMWTPQHDVRGVNLLCESDLGLSANMMRSSKH